jgi:hypothetical protein
VSWQYIFLHIIVFAAEQTHHFLHIHFYTREFFQRVFVKFYQLTLMLLEFIKTSFCKKVTKYRKEFVCMILRMVLTYAYENHNVCIIAEKPENVDAYFHIVWRQV